MIRVNCSVFGGNLTVVGGRIGRVYGALGAGVRKANYGLEEGYHNRHLNH